MSKTDEGLCEISGLPEEQCDHCKQIRERARDPRPTLYDMRAAEKDGTCHECGAAIKTGDMIGWYKAGDVKMWAHYGCGR